MPMTPKKRIWFAFSLVAMVVVLAACGLGAKETPEPTPTRTPKPTFTPTPEGQVANAFLFETPVTLEAPATSPILPTDTPTPIPTNTPTPEPPTPTPTNTPVPPVVFADQAVNVRNGPGTRYPRIGRMTPGERYPVTGKNPAGDWWQIDFNGRIGWVIDRLVQKEGQIDSVEVVAAIPTPPPAPTRPPPTPTPVPQPTQPPAPRYEFNIALVQTCEPQEAGTWFRGTVYKGGQPANGYRVVFSYAPDGPWATQPAITGPHEGYPNWAPGFYEHIISAPGFGPKAGNWFVWIVDANGNRISEIANFQSTGPGGNCNQAVVDFDSR
ncbi:MAG: SH3 domain-containing protein [Chloroflexi bacterium]|nr:SH3 domain-containing protein [Chloroflexota bacterium]